MAEAPSFGDWAKSDCLELRLHSREQCSRSLILSAKCRSINPALELSKINSQCTLKWWPKRTVSFKVAKEDHFKVNFSCMAHEPNEPVGAL
uniref:Uncharacterized protein n=1 Tax=Oryza brachyantha TaxID=4533 RepID=J3MJM1_ORYBR